MIPAEHPGGHPSPPASPRRPPLLRVALLFYGLLLAAALVWMALGGPPPGFADVGAAQRGLSPASDLAAGLLAGALVIGLSHEFTRRSQRGQRLARALAALLGRLSWSECVGLALLSGVSEEAFFRGALQPQVGLWAASALFALCHFAPQRDLWPWTLFSLAAGLLLGALFEATGNLLAPVAAHALINAVNLRLLSVRYAAPD